MIENELFSIVFVIWINHVGFMGRLFKQSDKVQRKRRILKDIYSFK